jgi:tetratricopeptide (TPR) repeat protein
MMGLPNTPDDFASDIDALSDATIADNPLIDLGEPGTVDAADEEFEQLMLESQLEDSDASAPGLDVVSPDPTAGSTEWYIHGVELLRRKEWPAAVPAFEQALGLDAARSAYHAPKAMACLGYALMKLGRADQSVDHYRSALELSPNLPGARTGLAAALLTIGADDEAIVAFAEASRVLTGRVPLHFNHGNLLARAGRMEEAEAAFQAALAIDANHVPTLTNLGALLAQGRRFDEALEVLSRVPGNSDGAWRARFNLALVFGKLQQWDQAIDLCRALIADRPSSTRVRILTGRIMRCAGRHLEAIELLDDYMEWKDRTAAACELLGLVHNDLGNADQAMVFWKEALRSNPTFVRIHVHVARARLGEGAVSDADVAIQTAIELRPDRSASWTVCGQVEFARERMDAAIKALEKAIKLDPSDSEAHYWLGRAHLGKGSMIGALRQCEQLEAMDPPLAARLRARVY